MRYDKGLPDAEIVRVPDSTHSARPRRSSTRKALNGVSGFLDDDVDLGALVLRERFQHVSHGLLPR